jgi:hypothetical protein
MPVPVRKRLAALRKSAFAVRNLSVSCVKRPMGKIRITKKIYPDGDQNGQSIALAVLKSGEIIKEKGLYFHTVLFLI